MAEIQRYSTDVLVVGGGIAGCFAALEACKGGAEVILMDKGYVSSSGQTPYAGTLTFASPTKGNRQEMLDYIRLAGDYLANMDFAELAVDKGLECIEDMIAYGAEFKYNEDGTLFEEHTNGGWTAAMPEPTQFPMALRKAVLKAGATILDRMMAVELIVENGEPITRNAEGDAVEFAPHLKLGVEFEIHAGRGPVFSPDVKPGGHGPSQGAIVSGSSHGMACHKTEGIWPAGKDCSTSLPGLFAAGDNLGTMTSGAAYSNIGIALGGSATTGKVAGASAATYCKDAVAPTVSDEKVQAIIDTVYAPMQRKGGFTADWVVNYLQNLTAPYFVFFIKEETRLQQTLGQVRFIKSHIVPKLYATNDHELRQAIEAKNMVENVELKLMAGLARKESRGTHYREDYPERDEENFSAWITFRLVNGEPVMEKHPLPDAWKWQEGEPRYQQFPTSF